MYKILYFWFAIVVPALSMDEETFRKLGVTPKLPDLHTILSNLEETDPNSTCTSDFERYVLALGDENWAKQMFDSIEKLPYGALYGRRTYLGSFDECITANEGNFTGQHCMVDLIIDLLPQGPMFFGLVFSFGICVPSTCTASQIQSAIGYFELEKINVTVQVIERNCWTSAPITLSTGEWIVILFLVLIGIIAVSSTIFDVMHRHNRITSSRHELYSSFSLYTNTKQLMKINNGPSNIGCLHGVRTLTMCWVILCHEYIMGIFAPILNQAAVSQDFLNSKYKIPITNGFVSVDTFFLLSGLLVTLVFFRSVSRTGSYDVPVAMIHRFIRLTPAFAAMVMIQSTLVPKMGRGPMWNKAIGSGVDACKESWWSGLLYLQNFIKPSSSCLGQSWYLSSDMQMFWLSPILLYPLLLWRTTGTVLMFFGLAAAMTTNFVVALIFELGPHLFNSRSPRQFDTDYTQTHMRLTPYIVGMGLGYIICGIKANKIKVNLSKTWIILGWLMSTGLCLGSMYAIIYFMDNGYVDKIALSSAYLTFHRLTWSLGLAWVIFACIAGYGGPVDYILSLGIFQIIGKISYCMFLVHFTYQLMKIGISQTDFYAHDFYFISNFLSTLLFSIMLAVPLYLFFEAPFSNLDRYFLRNLKIFPYPKKEKKESGEATPKGESAEP